MNVSFIDAYIDSKIQMSAENYFPDRSNPSRVLPLSPATTKRFRPYQCSECGRRSNWRWDLKKHIRTSSHPNAKLVELSEYIAKSTLDEKGKGREENCLDHRRKDVKLEAKNYRLVANSMEGDVPHENEKISLTVDTRKTKKFKCSACAYRSNFRSDVGRHIRHKHDRQTCRILVMSDAEAASTLEQYMDTWARKKFVAVPGKRSCRTGSADFEGNGETQQRRWWKCGMCNYHDVCAQAIHHHWMLHHVTSEADETPQMIEVEEEDIVIDAILTKQSSKHCFNSPSSSGQVVDKKFRCEICPYKCEFVEMLNLHKSFHARTDGSGFSCPHCPFYIYSHQLLNQHLALHSEDKKEKKLETDLADCFKCEHCPFTGFTRNEMDVHASNHVVRSDAPFKCPHCSYWVKQERQLGLHVHLHGDIFSRQQKGVKIYETDADVCPTEKPTTGCFIDPSDRGIGLPSTTIRNHLINRINDKIKQNNLLTPTLISKKETSTNSISNHADLPNIGFSAIGANSGFLAGGKLIPASAPGKDVRVNEGGRTSLALNYSSTAFPLDSRYKDKNSPKIETYSKNVISVMQKAKDSSANGSADASVRRFDCTSSASRHVESSGRGLSSGAVKAQLQCPLCDIHVSQMVDLNTHLETHSNEMCVDNRETSGVVDNKYGGGNGSCGKAAEDKRRQFDGFDSQADVEEMVYVLKDSRDQISAEEKVCGSNDSRDQLAEEKVSRSRLNDSSGQDADEREKYLVYISKHTAEERKFRLNDNRYLITEDMKYHIAKASEEIKTRPNDSFALYVQGLNNSGSTITGDSFDKISHSESSRVDEECEALCLTKLSSHNEGELDDTMKKNTGDESEAAVLNLTVKRSIHDVEVDAEALCRYKKSKEDFNNDVNNNNNHDDKIIDHDADYTNKPLLEHRGFPSRCNSNENIPVVFIGQNNSKYFHSPDGHIFNLKKCDENVDGAYQNAHVPVGERDVCANLNVAEYFLSYLELKKVTT